MAKRLTLICLFLFAVVGVKAQQTICYHIYKYVDPITKMSQTLDTYVYFHFQGIYCYWTMEKNEEYNSYRLFRFMNTTSDNCDHYVGGRISSYIHKGQPTSNGIVWIGEHGYQFYDGFGVVLDNNYKPLNGDFWVSNDKASINWFCKSFEVMGTSLYEKILVGKRVYNPPQKPKKPTLIE